MPGCVGFYKALYVNGVGDGERGVIEGFGVGGVGWKAVDVVE